MTKEDRLKQFWESPIICVLPPEFSNWLAESEFFTAPASTKYHGNYEGGLFDHSFLVMETLVDLTRRNNLEWQREGSPFIVGLLHDLCKIDQYTHPEIAHTLGGETIPDTSKWEYRTDTLLTGHGDKSVMMIASHMQLTEEEVMCIRYHMGAYTEKSEWEYYGRAIEKYPNVLWTHTADMIASKIYNT